MKFWQSLLNEILAKFAKDEDEILIEYVEWRYREKQWERVDKF